MVSLQRFRKSTAKKPSLARQPTAAESHVPVASLAPVGQHVPMNLGNNDLYADRPTHAPFEQHAFINASGATMEADFCFNMDTENLPKGITKQVAFSDASNMRLIGGFFGMGSASIVKQLAVHQLQRQMAQDALNTRLEIERLALSRDIELNERLLQQWEKVYGINKGLNTTSGLHTNQDELCIESLR